MSEQIDLYIGYSYASAEWRQETSKHIVDVEDYLKNTRERSNMDLDLIELTTCIMNDKFIKIDMIN